VADEKKPRGRRPGQSGQIVGTRLQPELLAKLDAWRKEQSDLPTRPEAIRRIIEQAVERQRD
jgi:metal-responsive CopG/Arc/MetJ family transcriptional regulator